MVELELFPNIGLTFNELLNTLKSNLNDLDIDIDKIQDSYIINSALGNDLDSIGNYLNIIRNINESDTDYKDRLLTHYNYIATRSVILNGINLFAQDILGITPTLLEYPEFDFTNLIGQNHPGLFVKLDLVDILTDPDLFLEFKKLITLYKPAGVPYILGGTESLVDSISGFIDVYALGWIFFENTNIAYPEARWNTEKWDESLFDENRQFIDKFEWITPYYGFLLTISGFIDTFGNGLINFDPIDETYSELLKAELDKIKILYSDSISTFIDFLTFGNIDLPFTEQIVANDFEMQLVGGIFGYFLTTMSESLFQDGILTGLIDINYQEYIYGWDSSLFDNNKFDKDFIDDWSYAHNQNLGNEIYSESLIDALNQIKVYFDPTNELVSNIVDSLDIGDIVTNYIDSISGFIDSINGLIDFNNLTEIYSESLIDSFGNGLINFDPIDETYSELLKAELDKIKILYQEYIYGWDSSLFDNNKFDKDFIDDWSYGYLRLLSESITSFVYSYLLKIDFDKTVYGIVSSLSDSFGDGLININNLSIQSVTGIIDTFDINDIITNYIDSVNNFIDTFGDGLIDYNESASVTTIVDVALRIMIPNKFYEYGIAGWDQNKWNENKFDTYIEDIMSYSYLNLFTDTISTFIDSFGDGLININNLSIQSVTGIIDLFGDGLIDFSELTESLSIFIDSFDIGDITMSSVIESVTSFVYSYLFKVYFDKTVYGIMSSLSDLFGDGLINISELNETISSIIDSFDIGDIIMNPIIESPFTGTPPGSNGSIYNTNQFTIGTSTLDGPDTFGGAPILTITLGYV